MTELAPNIPPDNLYEEENRIRTQAVQPLHDHVNGLVALGIDISPISSQVEEQAQALADKAWAEYLQAGVSDDTPSEQQGSVPGVGDIASVPEQHNAEEAFAREALENMTAASKQTVAIYTRWDGGFDLKGPGDQRGVISHKLIDYLADLYKEGELKDEEGTLTQPSTEMLAISPSQEVIVNPLTDRTEAAASVYYIFGTHRESFAHPVTYLEQNRRPGNELHVQAQVPLSTAQAFMAAVRNEPTLVREFARRAYNMAVRSDDVEGWSEPSDPSLRIVSPPYDKLSSGRELSLVHLSRGSHPTIENIPIGPA